MGETRAIRLLFVCTGNICRSLMAERISKHMAASRGLLLETRSAGVAAESYYVPPPEITAALKPLGLDAEGHRARLVGREQLGWCDVALTMTEAQRDIILEAFPEFTRKVFLLRAYAGLPEADVADPMGKTQEVYDACRDELVLILDALLDKLMRELPR